jgi:putative Holliday junction resolvase
MKYLGVDYGAKRVGIAISDAEGKIAFPRGEVNNDEKLLVSIARLAEEEKVGHIVVGDTRASGGADNPITSSARAFVTELEKTLAIPVECAPEIWSSIEASRYAPEGSEHSNAAAAAIILQRFLDMHAGDVQ